MTENAFEVQASEEVAVNYDGDAFDAVEVDHGLGGEISSKFTDHSLFFNYYISGSNMSGMGGAVRENGQMPHMNTSVPREEPEKIRKWREEQKLRLEKKGMVPFGN